MNHTGHAWEAMNNLENNYPVCIVLGLCKKTNFLMRQVMYNGNSLKFSKELRHTGKETLSFFKCRYRFFRTDLPGADPEARYHHQPLPTLRHQHQPGANVITNQMVSGINPRDFSCSIHSQTPAADQGHQVLCCIGL